MKKYLKLTGFICVGLILFGACTPSLPAPAATITTTVANNVVTFSIETTNSTAYKWRFGDGDSAIVYSGNPLTHSYQKDGTSYTVTLLMLGPGGQTTATATVVIPKMTQHDMLTGGSFFANGKPWRISSASQIILAAPDSKMTALRTYQAGLLTTVQLGQAYTDQYIFQSSGNYVITSKGGGVLAGLAYCTVNGIANVQPAAADSLGLTYATPKIPTGLTFALNTGKTLTVATTSNGITATSVSYTNVTTLSFPATGFLGLRDFMNECIVQELSPVRMTIAFFLSRLSPQLLQIGKATAVLIVTFEVAQ